MIILDTNVISELMLEAPEATVLSWFRELPTDAVATTAICVAELLYGIAEMPESARRERTGLLVTTMIDVELRSRVLPFDSQAAVEFAEVFNTRRQLGRPVSHPDAQIASIARVHRASVATRNVRDFEYAGVEIINPWEAEHGA